MVKLSPWFIGGLTACLLYSTQSSAADNRLFLPQYDLSIRNATLPTKPGGPLPYAATRPDATWSVVAWGIPDGPLPAFSKSNEASGVVFSSRTPSASVVVKQQNKSQAEYELSQDGAILPCSMANGHPAEFDLLLHPNNKQNSFEQTGYTDANALKDGLDAFSAVTLKTRLSFKFENAKRSNECGVASGNAVAGFILINPSARQTLFYDVILASACGPQPAARQAHCEKFLADPWSAYFSQRTPFGVDDPSPLLGVPFLKNGESKSIVLNILPGLIAAIGRGPKDMDRDPSHWRLHGFLNGQIIYGGIKITTSWSDLTVLADRK